MGKNILETVLTIGLGTINPWLGVMASTARGAANGGLEGALMGGLGAFGANALGGALGDALGGVGANAGAAADEALGLAAETGADAAAQAGADAAGQAVYDLTVTAAPEALNAAGGLAQGAVGAALNKTDPARSKIDSAVEITDTPLQGLGRDVGEMGGSYLGSRAVNSALASMMPSPSMPDAPFNTGGAPTATTPQSLGPGPGMPLVGGTAPDISPWVFDMQEAA